MNIEIANKKGFSLVELVIYLAVFSVMSAITIASLLTMMNSYVLFALTRDINSTATVGIDRMVREIRLADSISDTGATYGTNPGHLVLDTVDQSNNPTTVEFYISNGRLVIKEGASTAVNISPKNVMIDNLVFEKIITASISEAIKTEVTLSATRGNISTTKKYYITTVLRRSY